MARTNRFFSWLTTNKEAFESAGKVISVIATLTGILVTAYTYWDEREGRRFKNLADAFAQQNVAWSTIKHFSTTGDNAELVQPAVELLILTHAPMSVLNLKLASLSHLHADWSNMAGARIESSNLTLGTFKHADLRRAVFQNSALNGASFEKANLAGADFTQTQLTYANFSGADFYENDLKADFTGACYYDGPKSAPKGLPPEFAKDVKECPKP